MPRAVRNQYPGVHYYATPLRQGYGGQVLSWRKWEAIFAAMRQWTREWWSEEMSNYHCFTPDAVINEIESGDHPEKRSKLVLLESVALLDITWEIEEIVEVYISNYLMPKDELGDALHLAIASYHKIDFLPTWNCKHLANANKRDHIRRINERLKLFTPELVTPLELTGI